jgi:hypothetical protein
MRRRQAFTLVELLVSMALVIFIMVILSQAFIAGLETFRQLKAIGDMQERLRGVASVLRNDLAADHFDGRRRLSDPDFWQIGPPREGFFRIFQGAPPVVEGYDADGVPSLRAANHYLHYTVRRRGNRRESFFSAPVINLSNRLPMDDVLLQQSAFFESDNPGSTRFQDPVTYTSQWAEVAVFLRPNGVTTQGGTAGAVPLYGLYRREVLAVPDNRHANWETPITVTSVAGIEAYLTGGLSGNPATYKAPIFSGISCKKKGFVYTGNGSYNDTLYFNNPTDLTIPERRFGMVQTPGTGGFPLRATLPPANADLSYPIFSDFAPPATPPANAPMLRQDFTREGTDLLLNDVISMDVAILVSNLPNRTTNPPAPLQPYLRQPAFIDLFDPRLYRLPNDNPDPGIYPPGQANPRNPLFYDSKAPNTNNRPAVFDTWSSEVNETYDYSSWASVGNVTSAPMVFGTNNRLLAIKITIRVWDQRSQQARQITMIQDL